MRDNIKQMIEKIVQNNTSSIDLSLGEASVIWGEASAMDSMELVSLIVAIEEGIENAYGFPIALADAKAFSLKNSPFSTLGRLTDYTASLVMEVEHV